jgi:methyl coenzyme M reductase subunit C
MVLQSWATALSGIKTRRLIPLSSADARRKWTAINAMAGLRTSTIPIISLNQILKQIRIKIRTKIYPPKNT